MIRRLKKDVLKELPAKIRQKIHIPGDKGILKIIQDKLKIMPNDLREVEDTLALNLN